MTHLLLLIIYLAFISLGLPDALLGSAWPTIYPQFAVPVSYAGIISMIIALGTIVSSLQSDRLTRKLGTGKVTAISVAITAAALFGFSISHSFLALCLWAVPYGLGAGSVDASLNNYVALHYKSRHMSWLHCMWGIGASVGPYIMGFALTRQMGWNAGYRIIAVLQVVLTVVLVFSLPLWRSRSEAAGIAGDASGEGSADGSAAISGNSSDSGISASSDTSEEDSSAASSAASSTAGRALSLREILAIPGAKEVMLMFFCYCAIEQTAGLWAASYLTLFKGISAESAAGFAAMFYIGIMAGRAVSGFITMKLNDTQMIYLGQSIITIGIIVMLLPLPSVCSLAALILIGLGCAPIYPSVIHSTPARFGADRSQAVIGAEMASAYVGTCLMPPVFGMLANNVSVGLLPVFLSVILLLMFVMFRKLNSDVK